MNDRRFRLAWIGFVGGALAVVFGALVDVQAAGGAWLFATFMALGLSAGALSLLLTAQLTGGEWIEPLRPVLQLMAGAMPAVGLAFLVLLVFAPSLYQWAGEGAKDLSVAYLYLNWPLALVRLLVAIAGWSLAAIFVAGAAPGRGQVAAGLALVFHVGMTVFLSYDWMLALQPAFTSSAFGAFTAILFLYSAICAALVVSPPADGKPRRDAAGLVIAAALGVVYIGFMQFLIIWYGDLPETAKFYLERSGAVAATALVLAAFVGGLLPVALLVTSAGRGSAMRIRLAATAGLAGIALNWGWCAIGLFGWVGLAVAPFALLAVLSGIALAASFASRRYPRLVGRAGHG